MARAGNFRERALFERPPASTDVDLDDYGNEADDVLAAIATVWADIRMEGPGSEKLGAGRLEATEVITLRVRDSATMRGVTGGDRVTARGKVWNLQAAGVHVGRKRDVLEFTGITGAAQ